MGDTTYQVSKNTLDYLADTTISQVEEVSQKASEAVKEDDADEAVKFLKKFSK